MDPFRYVDAKEPGAGWLVPSSSCPQSPKSAQSASTFARVPQRGVPPFYRSQSAPAQTISTISTSASSRPIFIPSKPRPILGPSYYECVTGGSAQVPGRSRSSSSSSGIYEESNSSTASTSPSFSHCSSSGIGASDQKIGGNLDNFIKGEFCKFCYKNGETVTVYKSHSLHKIMGTKRIVQCPVLRRLVCEECGQTGDFAHTISHCPKRKNSVSVALLLKNTPRKCSGVLRNREFNHY